MYETPYQGPVEVLGPYRPARQLGAPAAACPSRPWWWLLLAFAAGGAVAYKMAGPKKKKNGRR